MASSYVALCEDVLRQAIRLGIHRTKDRGERRASLLPVWRDSVHTALVTHGCPCHTPACFARLDEDSQVSAFRGSMADLDDILELLDQGSFARHKL